MDKRISGFKHLAIYLVVVAVVMVLVWVGHSKWSESERVAKQGHEVQGQLLSKSDDVLDLVGVYVLDADREGSDFKSPKKMTIKINPKTKFFRTNWVEPTDDQISGKQPLPLYAQHLEIIPGQLSDLEGQQGILVSVKSVNGIFGRSSITADEIYYSLPVPGPKAYGFYGHVNKAQDKFFLVTGTFILDKNFNIGPYETRTTLQVMDSDKTVFHRTEILVVATDKTQVKKSTATLSQFKTDVATGVRVSAFVYSSSNFFGKEAVFPGDVYYSVVKNK